MRIPRWRSSGYGIAAVATNIVLLSACAGRFGAAPPAAGGAAIAPVPSQPTFTVTRGSITDIIRSTGRVVAAQQQALSFRQSGHLSSMNVHLNDKVKAGQVLATLDTTTLQKQIQQQQAAVDAATLNLEKTKELIAAQGSSGQGGSKVITPQDVASAEAATASAQAGYDAAEANLAAVATPDPQAVKLTRAMVAQAQTVLAKAQLHLQNLTGGPTAAAQQQAQAAIQSTQAKLDAAKQQLAVIQAGPTAPQIAQARAALEQAQAQFQSAQAAYNAFLQGPTPAQQQQATLAVTQAKNALYAAQTKRDSTCNNVGKRSGSGGATTQADCDAANAAVNTAQSNLDAAQATLNQLGDVSPAARLAAEAAYKQAEDALTAAQVTYQEMLQGAIPAANGAPVSGHVSHADQVAGAQAAVQAAQSNVVAAQAALAALTPTANEVAQAQQAVVSAQATLAGDQAELAALLNPTPESIRRARDLVTQAGASVTVAQARAEQLKAMVGQKDTSALDVAIQENVVKQAQLGVEALQDQLSQMQIVAPFDGVVIGTTGQAGAQVGAYSPVVTIANPKSLEISMSLDSGDLSRVAIGQKATLTIQQFPGQNIAGTVTGLPSAVLAASNQNENSPGAQAQQAGAASTTAGAAASPASGAVIITPEWPGPGADLGQVARVSISAETRNDVLLVPTQAINKVNNRTFVLLDQGGHELPVDVQIGIQNTDLTEVQTGLQAGQKVFQRAG